jgi:hypothetical protein
MPVKMSTRSLLLAAAVPVILASWAGTSFALGPSVPPAPAANAGCAPDVNDCRPLQLADRVCTSDAECQDPNDANWWECRRARAGDKVENREGAPQVSEEQLKDSNKFCFETNRKKSS